MRSNPYIPLLRCVALLGAVCLAAQADEPQLQSSAAPKGKFTFVRVEYDSEGGYGESWYNYDSRTWLRWETDYPEAERNFLYRLRQLTTIDADPEPIHLPLTDPRLTRYPFIYMCDVGWQVLSDREVKALREYLLKGGFLWADDFWGIAEWQQFERNMKKVFPELTYFDIPNDHPILKIVFPLPECPQIPAKVFYDTLRQSFDPPDQHKYPHGGIPGVSEVNFRGWQDSNGRLMVVATHNSDVGDGWERETEAEEYFRKFSVPSYAIGVNIITYALTH
jgi:hypothetical protein